MTQQDVHIILNNIYVTIIVKEVISFRDGAQKKLGGERKGNDVKNSKEILKEFNLKIKAKNECIL